MLNHPGQLSDPLEFRDYPGSKLSDLLPMDQPLLVKVEVVRILESMVPGINVDGLERTFDLVWRLYSGHYPGYRACNTGFHDFFHTTDVLLAHARLIHGAVIDGFEVTARQMELALISALLHDVGYIQTLDDRVGRGGKYTLTHVTRGCLFAADHAHELGLRGEEVLHIQAMLRYTDLGIPRDELGAPDAPTERLGRMLGAADLIGQMADRTYLEKLPYLYEEFREGNLDGYASVEELMHRTIDFYAVIFPRLDWLEHNASRYYRLHFNAIWGVDQDLYRLAIERHKNYLSESLVQHGQPRLFLRRQVNLPPGLVDSSVQTYPIDLPPIPE